MSEEIAATVPVGDTGTESAELAVGRTEPHQEPGANRVLRETEMSTRRRAEVVDQLAAVLILQAFMQFRKATPQSE